MRSQTYCGKKIQPRWNSRYFRALFSDSRSPVPPGKDKAAIDKKSSKIPPVSKPKNAKFNTNFHIGIFARENTVYVIYVDNFFWIVDNSPVLPKVIHIYPQKRMFVLIVRLSKKLDYI